MTPVARSIILSCPASLGWDMDFLPVRAELKGKQLFLQNVTNYIQVARAAAQFGLDRGVDISVPRVGDPCLSSGLKGLLEIFRDYTVQVIPGISSTQIAAALARINLDESVVVSFHDYGDPELKKLGLLNMYRLGRHVIALASPDLMPNQLAEWLIQQGVEAGTRMAVYSSLTLPEETHTEGTLREIAGREFFWLSVSVVYNKNAPGAYEDYAQWVRWREQQGLPHVS